MRVVQVSRVENKEDGIPVYEALHGIFRHGKWTWFTLGDALGVAGLRAHLIRRDRAAEPREPREDARVALGAAVAHAGERLREPRLVGVAAVGEQVDRAPRDIGRDLHPGERAQPRRASGREEARRPLHRVVVREDGGREPRLRGERDELLGAPRPVGARGVQMQVDQSVHARESSTAPPPGQRANRPRFAAEARTW